MSGAFSHDNLAWWLPSSYIAVISLWYVYPLIKKAKSKGAAVAEDLVENNALEPLLSSDPRVHSHTAANGTWVGASDSTCALDDGPGDYVITATATLWATLFLAWSLSLYHAVKGALAIAHLGGADTSITLHCVLAVSWAVAALCRNADHWYYSPQRLSSNSDVNSSSSSNNNTSVDEYRTVAAVPKNRRMWPWLFPFFNLAFVTAITRYIANDDGGRGHEGKFMSYLSDDRFLEVIAAAVCLITVTYSCLIGSRVILLHHPPNAELKAGLLSAALFSWFSDVIVAGQKKQLGLSDLPPQNTWDRSEYVWYIYAKTARAASWFGKSIPHTTTSSTVTSTVASGSSNGSSSSSTRKPGLAMRLFRLSRSLFIAQGTWQLVATLSEFTSPLAMKQIVDFVSNYKGGSVNARTSFYVALLFIGPIIQGIADGRNFHMGRRIGCRVRSALVGAIFQKTLKTDMSASSYSQGELTNLMSVDATSVLEYACYAHFIWTSALSIVISVCLLFYVLGVSAVGGLVFMIISMPLGKWTATKTQAYQRDLMKAKDSRMSVITEIMSGIRVIKMFAWESKFLERISEARRIEMQSLRSYMITMAIVIVQWNSVTTLVGLCTFLVHTRILGRSLSASQGFTALSLFNLLRFPLLVLPDVFNFFFQAKVSLERIEAYLGRDEVEELISHSININHSTHSNTSSSLSNTSVPRGVVSVINGTFQWSHPKLDDATAAADSSTKTDAAANNRSASDVSGAGRSSNDAVHKRVNSNDVTDDVYDTIDTIKDINNSASTTDSSTRDSISKFLNGRTPPQSPPSDTNSTTTVYTDTNVTSRNANTIPTLRNIHLEAQPGQLVCIYGPTGSGKSSLCLALLGEVRRLNGTVRINGSIAYCSQRAWIQNATLRDNILFGLPYDAIRYTQALKACALGDDLDLLEAGDMTEIGERGINLSGGQQQRVSLARALYSDADVYILDDVLSAVDAHVGEHLFKHCIRDLLVKRGKTVILVSHQIPITARYADKVVLIARNGTIAETGNPQALMADSSSRLYRLLHRVGGTGELIRQRSVSSNVQDKNNSNSANDTTNMTKQPSDATAVKDKDKPAATNVLISEEERAKGAPDVQTYIKYCIACGGIWAFLIPYIALHLSYNGLQFAQNLMLSNWVDALESDGSDTVQMWAYIGVSIAVIIAIFGRSIFQSFASLRASRSLHDNMASIVMRAPMGWYERTPLGRILNRFSSDTQEIDKDLMEEFGTTLACFFSVASIVIVISYTAPWLILGLIPISILSWLVARLYLNVSRELKRLDSVSKSPIYQHFTESVAGVSTIRAFGAQNRFVKESFKRVDNCNRAHFGLWTSNRWFNMRVQAIGAAVAVLSGAFLVYYGKDHIPAATAGLALLYALNFTDALKYLVREHALLEMQMNSVERVIEFTSLPQEASPKGSSGRLPTDWPSQGGIEFRHLTVQYPSSSTPVIIDMSFKIDPQTRVGIVGRTGAGKSSLTAALFRIVEPKSGSIIIDGIDIVNDKAVGLDDIRSNLAIVPQDPQVFRGTIRSNLDPFNQYSDPELWNALKRSHLSSTVDSLDAIVEENGINYSVGQRQLMCLARAFLRKSTILVMDEASASVDPETDQLIQEAMRNELRDCTVLCIAHRLKTIIYYDKVLVLEAGRVAEYDTPYQLLQDENSLFYALCKKSGALDELIQVAVSEHEAKQTTVNTNR